VKIKTEIYSRLTAFILVGNSPFSVSVNPSTNMVYISSRADNTISVIDGTTNTLVAIK
jgi:DNA-binding beta-propeller fold protein YncE